MKSAYAQTLLNQGREIMSENNSKSEYATVYLVNQLDKRLSSDIKNNRDRIDENSQMIARLEAVYTSLEGLPSTITNLDKTITVIGNNLDSITRNLSEVKESVYQQKHTIIEIQRENRTQNENIEKIDGKSKIDWAEFVTSNFWKVFLVFGAVYVVVRLLIERG